MKNIIEKCENFFTGNIIYFSKFSEVELGISGWSMAAQEWGCTLQFFTREILEYIWRNILEKCENISGKYEIF